MPASVAGVPRSLRERALGCLSVRDLLAARAVDRSAPELVQRAVQRLVQRCRSRQLPVTAHGEPGIRWLLALSEVRAPPRLVVVGGYNSAWNQHEPVLEVGDGGGCEQSGEVVCSLPGGGTSGAWKRSLPRMVHRRADLALVLGQEPVVLYAVGGRHGPERHASVEALDLLEWRLWDRGWQPLPSMSLGRSGLVAGLADRRLLAVGGRSAGGERVLREAEALDLEGQQGWVAIEPMREPREYAASAMAGGHFWVLGGGTGSGLARTRTVEVFDAPAGRWLPGPDMIMERFGGGAVFHHGRIYVAGGSTHFPRKQLTTLEALDPREGGPWRLTSFAAPRGLGYCTSMWGCAVAAYDHSLFLCGGVHRESEESLDTIFRIDLRTMQLDMPTYVDGRGGHCRLSVLRWCGGACVL